MRFVLDQDVATQVGACLRKLGHDAWAADDAGLSEASDDDLTVYAQDKSAVLITHDVEFSKKRRKNVIGRHIFLRCDEWKAAELLTRDLPKIEQLLERYADLYVRLSFSEEPQHAFSWG